MCEKRGLFSILQCFYTFLHFFYTFSPIYTFFTLFLQFSSEKSVKKV